MDKNDQTPICRTKYGRSVKKPKFLVAASLPPPSKRKKSPKAAPPPKRQRPRAPQSLASIIKRKQKRKQKDVSDADDRKTTKKVKFADTDVIHSADITTQHDSSDANKMTARCRAQTTDSDKTTKLTRAIKTTVKNNDNSPTPAAFSETLPRHESQIQREKRRIQDRAAKRLHHLDVAYEKLNRCEVLLMEEYKRALKEEACLVRALQLSNESGKETLDREKREKDGLAVQRLEAALFNDDQDDDSDSDDSEDGSEEISVGIGDMEGRDYPMLSMDI